MRQILVMKRLCINWNKNVYYLLSISGCLGIIFIVAIAVVPEKSQLKQMLAMHYLQSTDQIKSILFIKPTKS